ncbi:hypothetical protein GOP47_0004632, partial [Adiantum capillus-veneris]
CSPYIALPSFAVLNLVLLPYADVLCSGLFCANHVRPRGSNSRAFPQSERARPSFLLFVLRALSLNRCVVSSRKAAFCSIMNRIWAVLTMVICIMSFGTVAKEQVVSREHAEGALLGVFVRDDAGATLEFLDAPITHSMTSYALHMPGGGIHAVGPGQVTDDSELTIAIARALKGHDPSHGFPADSAAKQYRAWYASVPFDVGTTCAMAFRGEGGADFMRAAAHQRNLRSESNGALMRVVPLAMWMATQPVTLMAEAAKQDALLSHPSIVCQEANTAYAIAVAHLLTHPGDADGALVAAASSHLTSTSVKRWLLEDSALDSHQLASLLDCTDMEGHFRHGFTLAFHFLRHRTLFEDAMMQTLQMGGDTDTNAAIVGGLLGAFHGAKAIPSFMKDPVLHYDCSAKVGRVRPPLFSPRSFYELMSIIYPAHSSVGVTAAEL